MTALCYADKFVTERTDDVSEVLIEVVQMVTSLKTPIVEQAYCGINYATTKHSLRAALQLSPPDVQRSVTLC